MANRPASPTVRRRELANRLRALRLKAGRTLEEAAHHLETSAATVSRVETGIRVPRARDVRDLLEFYGLTDKRETDKIVALVAEAKEAGWWETYSQIDEEYATLIGLEAAATRLQQYEGMLVAGLLQTPDYARAYLREAINPGLSTAFDDDAIENRVEIRLRRQRVVLESPGIPYEVIVDEAALRRAVGGSPVMNRQIRHLLEITDTPHVTIRLLPFDIGAHPGQPGGFTIITLPQEAVADVVYVESPAGQLFLEGEDDLIRRRRVWRVLYERALGEKETQEALHRMASAGGAG